MKELIIEITAFNCKTFVDIGLIIKWKWDEGGQGMTGCPFQIF